MSEETRKYVPFDQTHRLRQLLFVTTIVPEGQAESIVQINNEHEAAFCFMCSGRGTAPMETRIDWTNSPKKTIVFSVLRADKWPSYKAKITERFNVSKAAKGIAYSVPFSAIAGVSVYKMLANIRLFERPTSQGKTKRRKKK